jgi:hypothetical protein
MNSDMKEFGKKRSRNTMGPGIAENTYSQETKSHFTPSESLKTLEKSRIMGSKDNLFTDTSQTQNQISVKEYTPDGVKTSPNLEV